MATTKDIGEMIKSLNATFDEELYSTPEDQLEKEYYHFNWENDRSILWNIYQFSDSLELYKRFCRRWEEKHNGSCCVVERVRDTYLMPKIKEFLTILKEKVGETN